MNINLDEYLDEMRPCVTIFGKSYEVDSDFKKVLSMQRFASDLKGDADSIHQFLAFSLIGGETAADEILSHPMPFSVLQKLEIAVMAAMTGKKPEELEGQLDTEKKPSFRTGSHGKK
ncbi:hypothetical protein [Caproicibacter sp.]|uniref:hypothetical protein n=1 Tax=Caproicibacter sp. TaxID=2814884 RepID=UPI00398A34E4